MFVLRSSNGFIVYIAVVATHSLIPNSANVPILSGDNYADWKDQILLTLGCMDLDLVLRETEPNTLTDKSTTEEKATFDRWQRSNRLSLMLIKTYISKSISGSVLECDKVKDYMKSIEEQLLRSEKAQASVLMKKLSGTKLEKGRGVRAYIMEMRDIAAKLRSLEVDLAEPFLVHLILNSLPSQYGPLKISYNTHKENWSINELLTMVVQEEERLKLEAPESSYLVSHGKKNGKKGKGGKGALGKSNAVKMKKDGNTVKSYFYKRDGHLKRDCAKYKKWLEKKAKKGK